MLQPRDHATLEQLAARIRQDFPDASIWAFGSRVRDDATSESDLDVCVVLPRRDANVRARISELAWEVGFARELFISTVVFAKDMFENGPPSASPLVQTILEEGVAA